MPAARVIPVLLAVGVVALPSPSWADYETRASVSWNGVVRAHPDVNGFFQGNHATTKSGPTAGLNLTSVEDKNFEKAEFGTYGFAYVRGRAQALARVGKLEAFVDSELHAENDMVAGAAVEYIAFADLLGVNAAARWKDTVSITTLSGVPIGTPLIVSGTLLIDGALVANAEANNEGRAYSQATVSIQYFTGLELASGTSTASFPVDATNGTTLPPGIVDVPLFIQNGVARELGYSLHVTGRASATRSRFYTGSSDSELNANYYGTLTWGGITSVVIAATGEPIEDWTITSESGFDYSRPFPVPEPSSIALAGIVFSAWLRRARRPRR